MTKKIRARGEGSIYPTKKGHAAYVWVTTPEGERRRKYVYGQTRDIVHDKWIKLHEKAKQGPVAGAVPTLSVYLHYWLSSVVKPGVRPKPAETYEMHVRLYVIPLLGKVRLDRLGVKDIRQWLNALASLCQCCVQQKDSRRAECKRRCCALGQCCNQRLSRRTIQDVRSTLRNALNNAIVEELITRNPVDLVKVPSSARRHKQRFKPWTVEEARQFLESARGDNDPFYAAYVLILITGLRRSEVLGMSWDRINFADSEMTPSMGLQRVGKQLILDEAKTDASEEPVPLPDICAAALQLRRAIQNADKAAFDGKWLDDHNFVFTSRYGSPIDPRNFHRSFGRRCAKAGVRRIRLHDTRHTCGSLLAALDVHPRVAMQILRHSKINITMEIYTHVPNEVTRDALRKLADSIQGDDVA